ncbi:MAG TPA: LytTR family DNA-binding domain-containing protein, partial [Candidatus Dormibacteraeota bacterium]|nr:LytTR family DNA-binding domain-containing protein [Candidatus Dormibacteraeota bacterium]
IVDDEELGRKRIRKLLSLESEFEIVGESRDGREAIRAIEKFSPDLVFLDVQMPELGGFEVLSQISPAKMPVIIFVTAHDHFALKAFQAQALDYLLKPFDDERFAQSLQRARTYLNGNAAGEIRERLARLVQGLPSPGQYLSRVAVKSAGRVLFLKAGEIDWIEAAGNYVNLHVGKESYLLRGRMSELEKRFDPEQFFRIHRSTMVNLDRVKELQPLFKGESIVILKDGQQLSASRSCSQRLQAFLGPHL